MRMRSDMVEFAFEFGRSAPAGWLRRNFLSLPSVSRGRVGGAVLKKRDTQTVATSTPAIARHRYVLTDFCTFLNCITSVGSKRARASAGRISWKVSLIRISH